MHPLSIEMRLAGAISGISRQLPLRRPTEEQRIPALLLVPESDMGLSAVLRNDRDGKASPPHSLQPRLAPTPRRIGVTNDVGGDDEQAPKRCERNVLPSE
jgi:hypothetical protein